VFARRSGHQRHTDGHVGLLDFGSVGRIDTRMRVALQRHYLTDLVHLVVLTVLAATTGIMAVLILGLRAGPHVAGTLALYQCLGYGLLVVAAVLAVRVVLAVLRPTPS